MDVLGYARVSTKKQASSLKNQESAILQYAKQNNFNITNIYTDIASGNTKIELRPSGAVLLSESQKNKTPVIVTRLDRFSRNVEDAKHLSKNGITLLEMDIIYEKQATYLINRLRDEFVNYYKNDGIYLFAFMCRNYDFLKELSGVLIDDEMTIQSNSIASLLEKWCPKDSKLTWGN